MLKDPTRGTIGPHSARSGRLPGAAALVGFEASVRILEGQAQPWLPQPADWVDLTVESQANDPDSVLSLCRAALARRRDQPGWHEDAFSWLATPTGVLGFERGSGLRCIVNLSGSPYSIAGQGQALLSSVAPSGTDLPPDTAAWLRADSFSEVPVPQQDQN